MSDERRTTQRLRAYLPARLSQASAPMVETLTKDIGAGGLRCVSSALIPVGCELTIELSLPASRDVVTVRGRTAWFNILPESEQFDLGIRFIGVPDDVRRLLSVYFENSSRLSLA